jgi:predicted alpha/beta-fold hydrolase
MKWQLEKIFTKDRIALNGLFCSPEKPKKRAVLFIHGFPGNFYVNHEIINSLANKFCKSSLGFFSMNTRGHDIMNVSFKKNNKPLILGSALEKFEDCILDIDAGIKFLNRQGFNQIILIGISGGADKIGYYLSQKHSKFVTGGIFLSPGSNILIIKKELRNKFKPLLEKSLEMINRGKKK